MALSPFPNGSLHLSEDDRFWETALELGMPVSAHTHFGAAYPPFVTGAPSQSGAAPGAGVLCTRQAFERPLFTIAQLIFAGTFDRFPELQLYFAETNASWLPIGMQQFDENYQLYAHVLGHKLEKLPSEYIRDHVFFSFIQDRALTKMFDLVPVGNLMWGSDFPHSVTSFPNSREWLDSAFDGVDPGLRTKILVDTPARYFHLDATAELTPTPMLASTGA